MNAIGIFRACLLMVIAVWPIGGSLAVAQDYPPFGSTVPIAHFDHKSRPRPSPPPPLVQADGRIAQSAWNIELVGTDTLDGRPTYQPIVVRQGDRYIAYMGHQAGSAWNRLNGKTEPNGTSVLDVTDPKHPVYLSHIPGTEFPKSGAEGGGSQMARVCGGDLLPSSDPAEKARKHGRYFLLRTNGNSSGEADPGLSSQEIYEVTDPQHPVLLTTITDQLSNTHKNWWECDTGIAYLVANDTAKATRRNDRSPGWHQSVSNQHIKIYDLHDPVHPRYVRDFGMVGQQPIRGSSMLGFVSPPPGVHGPISAGTTRNRVYLPYGVGVDGMIEIVDRKKLLEGCTGPASSPNCASSPNEDEMLKPLIATFQIPGGTMQGAHTSFPIFGEEDGNPRNLLLVTSEEQGNECPVGTEPHAAWLFDITNESDVRQISVNTNDPARTLLDVPNGFDGSWSFSPSTFPSVFPSVLTPTDGAGKVNSFCNQGGRFGAHASSELFYPAYYGRLLFITWFTGGLRVFDIRNPDDAREIGYFIPAPAETGCGEGFNSACTRMTTGRNGHKVMAISSNNVELDDRGYIYLADRVGTGLHILRVTGDAADAISEKPAAQSPSELK